jgi:hypothetical protein
MDSALIGVTDQMDKVLAETEEILGSDDDIY